MFYCLLHHILLCGWIWNQSAFFCYFFLCTASNHIHVFLSDSGGDIDIVVASVKDVKVEPVKRAFQDVFGRATVIGLVNETPPRGFRVERTSTSVMGESLCCRIASLGLLRSPLASRLVSRVPRRGSAILDVWARSRPIKSAWPSRVLSLRFSQRCESGISVHDSRHSFLRMITSCDCRFLGGVTSRAWC